MSCYLFCFIGGNDEHFFDAQDRWKIPKDFSSNKRGVLTDAAREDETVEVAEGYGKGGNGFCRPITENFEGD